MPTKKCSKCGVEKDTTEFNSAKRNRDGLRGWCKGCVHDYSQLHKEENNASKRKNAHKHKEWYLKYRREYNKRPEVIARIKERRQTPEYKEYFQKYTTTKEYHEKQKLYRLKNGTKIREKELVRERAYRKNPQKKIIYALRARLGVILVRNRNKKSDKFINLIGCSGVFLLEYLKSLWKDGMSWNNYGFGKGKWVIDHIIPCDQFKPFTPDQQKACFHYTNLQPLWWEENASKSNKV